MRRCYYVCASIRLGAQKLTKGKVFAVTKQCWELRGCYLDEEMCARCPHNIPGEPCPAECKFSACTRATHVVARDISLILNPCLKYDEAIKEVCRMCEHFLTCGPCFAEGEVHTTSRQGNPNRFLL